MGTKTMAQMNKVMDPMKIAKTMNDFEQANAKMSMTEETMNDALDEILEDSDDESEEQAVIDKVLDQIGIEISGKLADAPSAHAETIGDKSKAKATDEDKEIEAMLAQLKA